MKNLRKVMTISLFSLFLNNVCQGQNPIIQTKFTADPAPMVYNETVYLYTTHDDNEAIGFIMKEWLFYTSTDMVNRTDHGAVASTCCPEGIGYSMSDSPVGPWHKTGTIMDHNPKSNGNPPGIIEYKKNLISLASIMTCIKHRVMYIVNGVPSAGLN